MEHPKPPIEPQVLTGLEKGIQQMARVFLPGIYITFALAVLVTLAFLSLAFVHLPFGIKGLDMANTGNVGQFIGGTVGTLFTIISSLLLVVTLWLQMNEYKLTRHELQQTVLAQQEMARAQAEQLGPLKEQALIGRQVMEMDLLSKAIQELREDMKQFAGHGVTGTIGVGEVIRATSNTLGDQAQFWIWLKSPDQNYNIQSYLGAIARVLLNFTILLERAELIYTDLTQRELPASAQRIRRKELVLLVNNECRDLMQALHGLEQNIENIHGTHSYFLDRFKSLTITRIQKCTQRLQFFSKVDLDQEG